MCTPSESIFLHFVEKKSIIKENTHNASDVTKLRMTDFQKRHKIEETKMNNENKSNKREEIMIIKEVEEVCVITINYMLR